MQPVCRLPQNRPENGPTGRHLNWRKTSARLSACSRPTERTATPAPSAPTAPTPPPPRFFAMDNDNQILPPPSFIAQYSDARGRLRESPDVVAGTLPSCAKTSPRTWSNRRKRSTTCRRPRSSRCCAASHTGLCSAESGLAKRRGHLDRHPAGPACWCGSAQVAHPIARALTSTHGQQSKMRALLARTPADFGGVFEAETVDSGARWQLSFWIASAGLPAP